MEVRLRRRLYKVLLEEKQHNRPSTCPPVRKDQFKSLPGTPDKEDKGDVVTVNLGAEEEDQYPKPALPAEAMDIMGQGEAGPAAGRSRASTEVSGGPSNNSPPREFTHAAIPVKKEAPSHQEASTPDSRGRRQMQPPHERKP